MTDILRSYTDLSSSSPRFQVATVLQSIINALPLTFDQSTRAALVRLLLRDLRTSSSRSRLFHKDAALALLALKTLGRVPAGSEPLTEASSLRTLLELSSSLYKEDRNASSEALKCIANTLLLYDHARITFISKEVGGGEICAHLLEKATTSEQIFTLSRIMFLATASPSSLILSLVEDKRHGRTIIDVIPTKVDMVLSSVLANKAFARDAMSELVKFSFNLLLHYPKLYSLASTSSRSQQEFQSTNLDGLLPSLLRVYRSLPRTFPIPLAPPLTHVIHALVTIPITPSLISIWFSTARSSSSSSRHLHSLNTPRPRSSSTLDRALNVFTAGRRSLSISSNNPTSMIGNSTTRDIVVRTMDLLGVVFSFHFPSTSNPDSREVREAFRNVLVGSGMSSETSLDELVSPLVALCTRICMMDQTSRRRVREWIIPPDLDRSYPLGERDDLLGRCIRLLGSVYHMRLKASVGEMLYAACDCDPSILSSLVGYGHVAGFLFTKGVLTAPPPPSANPYSSQRVVNPITGTYDTMPPNALNNSIAEMTEEEKEIEMDKLFVLFDRLDRSGAPPPSQSKTLHSSRSRRTPK
ncbi:guanine nucleotide exchange factor [Lentinula raphanica]|uniref:Guanine nucleotide exchange factor n=1 Tax=Lentinula raphanica TaxID=153919 RepID=A0AA38UL04_9AGAR|nr:guanine nucleotide exchange factor [Lentinula raphanica]KAJ3842462.1 guanine nucleotide exchange factor [Lentinula raphanica]